ncbi:MAG: hypothetical protein WCE24_09585 [Pseudolabrys sp.]
MRGETIARSGPLSGAPDEDDYQAFCQALSTSERGRAFLAGHARRNKNVDTEQLLAAIEQLQSVVVAQSTPQATDPIRRRLRDLLDEIGTAQCDLEALLLATKTEALAELIARVESRISGILWSLRADPVPEVETAPPASEVRAEPTEEIERFISQLCRCRTNLNCQFHRRPPRAHRPLRLCAARPSWQRSHSWKRPRRRLAIV